MTRLKLLFNTFAVFGVCFACSTLAQAQATRTWVSGVGDDGNPCNRTAPCKTFAGAMSKTAAGGEISALDPGGFGALTVTKSITVSGDGTLAGVLAAGTNGFIINAGAKDIVILRNISINGVGTGINGIRFLAGQTLRVENCTINGFLANGIDVVHAGSAANPAGELTVEDTTITNIGGVAVRIDTAVGGTINPSAVLHNVRISRAGIGFGLLKSSVGTISNSVISHVVAQAVVVRDTAVVNASNCVLSKNGIGIDASTAGSTVRFAHCEISNNGVGVKIAQGATGHRFGNSSIFGNTTADTQGTTTLRTDQ